MYIYAYASLLAHHRKVNGRLKGFINQRGSAHSSTELRIAIKNMEMNKRTFHVYLGQKEIPKCI